MYIDGFTATVILACKKNALQRFLFDVKLMFMVSRKLCLKQVKNFTFLILLRLISLFVFFSKPLSIVHNLMVCTTQHITALLDCLKELCDETTQNVKRSYKLHSKYKTRQSRYQALMDKHGDD